ncbi:MAG: glycosyltransferase [Chitinophagaceae bacterium]
MTLSIIIVNFNVKYFVEHCLFAVQRAIANIDAEVFVVDNCSSDGSVAMLQARFPWVHCVANTENVGFAKANNQAVAQAKGKYILYLNPDTIVAEDCFELCIQYMESNTKVGALGPKLIDGSGHFLPESKRGFPSVQAAFYKMTGLSSLFKKSKVFNAYHLGYLDENEIYSVDVLAGCFMFCRKSVIDEVGSFDEDYFMYGEDIDLSYKIKKAGFENIYFPLTSVIHFKGESTKKASLNYVKMFYKAMAIFAKKHLKQSNKHLFIFILYTAIYIRAAIALASRFFSIIKMPLIDAALMLISLVSTKTIWVKNIKPETTYEHKTLLVFFISYVIIWIVSIFFNGGYDKPYKPNKLMRGMLIGATISLALYGLLPEEIRFSRGITLLGALLSTLLLLLIRRVAQALGIKNFESADKQKNVLIVGTAEEELQIKDLLQKANIDKTILGTISPFEKKEAYQLGIFSHLKPLSRVYQITEIIYAQHHISFKQIIESIQSLGHHIQYKIHSFQSESIIGSSSKNTAGDLYTTDFVYAITTSQSKRNKRVFDIGLSLFFLLFGIVLVWFVKNKKHYFGNMFLILEGEKTWVGYQDEQFPKLKPHLLDVYPNIKSYEIPYDNKEHLNWLYAKNYSVWDDAKIVYKKWRMI